MKAAVYDFVFERNTDWNFNIAYNSGNASSYVPVNVAGFTAEFNLFPNRYPGTGSLITLTAPGDILIAGAEGRFRFTISKSENAALTEKEYYYTFEVTDTAGVTERILKGSIKIEM